MMHLKDKLAEFFYNELPPLEMADARRHIEECADCRLQVEQFETMHITLRSSPDWDPPRNIVFSAPHRRSRIAWFDWRSLAASTAAAAFVAAIAMRLSPALPPQPVFIPAAAPAIVQTEKIDYDRIINELRQSESTWVAKEMQTRDQEIQRLRSEVAYYDSFQRAVMKETLENGSAIQLLAQRTEQR